MNKVVNFLNNRYFVAILVGLFLLAMVRKYAVS